MRIEKRLLRVTCQCGQSRGWESAPPGGPAVVERALRAWLKVHWFTCPDPKTDHEGVRLQMAELAYVPIWHETIGKFTTKGDSMAKTTKDSKVYQVEVSQQADGQGWQWVAMDAGGRVKQGLAWTDYNRRADAVRGARRRCGANVRIRFA